MINVLQERCQPWRYNKAECRLCVETCPVQGCIRIEGSSLSVDAEQCIECGICTATCPSGALVFEGLTDMELWTRLEALAGRERVSFHCTLGPEQNGHPPEGSVHVPCLAIIKESHLVSLILSGVKKCCLDIDRCKGCSFSHGEETVKMAVSYARAILAPLAPGGAIFTDASSAATAVSGDGSDDINIVPGLEFSRRELFTYFKGKARDKAVERLVGSGGKDEPIISEKDTPARRHLIIDALKRRQNDHPGALDSTFDPTDYPIYNLKINKDCNLCYHCDAFCPTEAIKVIEGDNDVSIEFRLASCVGCYQCKELCPSGAISYDGAGIGLDRLVEPAPRVLVRMTQIQCNKCAARYFAELELEGCPGCKKRSKFDERAMALLLGTPAP